jgi:hypothetical protein
VQYKNADAAPGDNQIKPHFNLVNTGTTAISLSTIKLRYWFTAETGATTYSVACDWAVVGCSTISGAVVTVSPARTGADRYLEISFSGGSIPAGGQSGEMQIRFNKTDWSNFTETNDYSYGTNTVYADSTKVTLYQSGTKIWGTEP